MMKIYKKIEGKRIISLLLAFLMLFSTIQIIGATSTFADVAAAPDTRKSDPSTMNDWTKYFGTNILSTENAGAVWTDKSVFTNADAFAGTGITLNGTDNQSFLVALSAIASSQSVTGLSNVPTDTMIVLDLSSSMYPSMNPSTVQTMLTAVNNTINKLQNINKHNRVGVVVYFGGPNLSQSNSTNSIVMLPLDRYSGSTTYLKANVSSNKLVSVAVNSGLKNEAGKSVSVVTRTVTSVAGTYAQLGILDAMNELVNADEKVIPADADFQPNVSRVPVMIFMSDGEPTASTEVFYKKGNAHWGNNSVANRSAAESDFVTQLTAAYAKATIDEAYSATTPLFYTLSLGEQISLQVMDPANNPSTTINKYWNSLITTGKTNLSVRVSQGDWGPYKDGVVFTVERTTVTQNGKTVAFPSSIDQMNYVDQAFTAASAGNLADAFEDIVTNIDLQSRYYPTLVQGDEDLDGYISFVDKIGEYMEVTDIKGIMIHDDLFSGVDMASNFVAGGGDLGTYEDPKPLGDELVWAVQARLGIDSSATARALLGLAYREKQLYYDEATGEYSNYIGWYANAAGQYLGFWNEGTTTMPQATGNTATDPAFLIKSYGYLGEVDETHGVDKSDMMYATVQVRESIATGEQTVVFSIPAALIPIVEYEVVLDEDGAIENLSVSGATAPMRLVYEVALREGINDITINDPSVVSSEYVAANTNPDGSVNFYTNQYEADNSTGYGTVNTYSYFRPSHQNNQYYFTTDITIYTDTNGTKYTGTNAPDAANTYYAGYQVYSKNGSYTTKTIYKELSDEAIGIAVKHSDNTWYVPAGAVHANPFGITEQKTSNETGTLTYSNSPFVDIYGHKIDETNHRFVVGATLGNNGKLTITPATGIKLSKTVESDEATNDSFAFVITGSSVDATKTYPAVKISADGTETETAVTFDANNQATVYLKDGEVLYITGMTAGAKYTITENETVAWVVSSVNGDTSAKSASLQLQTNAFSEAAFVNKERGTGSLTITKYVAHTLGEDYVIPNLVFDVTVTLSGIGTSNQTFEAIHSVDSSVTSVTTDANGVFNVQLKVDEQIEIKGLPIGTIVTVVESDPGAGFAASYYEAENQNDNFELGDGVLEIDGIDAAVVLNTYKPEKITPTINVGGTKYFLDEDGNNAVWTNEEFTFVLQQYVDGDWVDVDTKTATSQNPTFMFDTSSLSFDKVGVYAFQAFEIEPADEDKLPGVFYENEWHTFSVYVTDDDMDGKLEVSKIYSVHADKNFTQAADGSWTITTDFTNIQYITAPVTVVIDTKKKLDNPSNSPLVDDTGYLFGLYTDEACTIQASSDDDVRITKVTLVPTDAAGEGWIDIIINDVGTYTYYVKEIKGNNPKMTYSEKVVRVDITVTQIAQGKLHAETVFTTITNDAGEAAPNDPALNVNNQVEFTNSYNPTSVKLEIEATKTLNGRDMAAGEFDFEIRPIKNTEGEVVKGTTKVSATDGEAVAIEFATIEYTKVGAYFYEVVETSTDGNGITVDKTVYNVSVSVTDNNGELVAVVEVLETASDSISFVNEYEPEPIQHQIDGTKNLIGKDLLNDEFRFTLVEVDANGKAVENGINETVLNFADGSFKFSAITYTEAGVHYYQVSEVEYSVAHGITFDKTVYTVKITVTDDGLGNLSVVEEITADGTVNAITFTNTYTPNSTGANIHGSKILTGKVLGNGDYSFELYKSDADWNIADDALQIVANDEDGFFTFDILESYNEESKSYYFDKAGTYYFVVKETNGGETIKGVYYDDTVYRIKIDVVDNLRGNLVPTVYIYDSDDVQLADIIFRNSYSIISDGEVVITGTKILENLGLKDEMFSFNLYAADSDFLKGDLIDTVKNFNGEFEFVIEYTAEDVEIGTFYYIVEEENAGETINGITYASNVYSVTVTVTDNGEGGITTTLKVEEGPISFVNTYNADDTFVSIDGTKNLEGIRDLEEGEFTFELYEADENFNAIGTALQSVSNNANGGFVFEDVIFEEAGTYRFVVKENSDAPLGGVTYDTNEYHITVVVEDNENGNLIVTSKTIADKSGTDVENITFNNEYETTDATVVLSGDKVLTGKELSDGEFTFELYEADENFNAIGTALQSVANNANGGFVFEDIVFEEVGTYRFVIKENSDDPLGGIIYDTNEYHITIVVEDDKNGKLVITSQEVTDKSSTDVENITFNNKYETTDATVVLGGDKVLTGKDLADGEFAFLLYQTDSAFKVTAEKLIDNTVNDALGEFKFDAITFNAAGTYYYVIAEDVSVQKEGITYDESKYFVTVTVEDNGEGNLVVSDIKVTKDGTAVSVEDVVFNNTYIPEIPQTGDNSNSILWFALLMLSGAGIMFITIGDRRKKRI